MTTVNPFTLSENDVGNPFADPSITNALSSSSYDPPIPTTTASYPPPSANSAPKNLGRMDDLAAKEAELRRREEELAAREAQVLQQQESMRKQGYKPPNWPPFYPYIYHNIDEEIPEGLARRTMHLTYKYWLGTVALLFFNMIACLTMMVSHPANMNNVASDFGVSFVYMFFIAAGSFFLWYRPVYWAYQKENSLYFYVFMIFSGCHGIFSAYMAVGIPGSGAAGFINFLGTATAGAVVAGIFTGIAFLGWVAEFVIGFYLWKQVHNHFQSHGHSFEKAKSEMVGLGIRSGAAQEVVRQQYA